MRLQVAILRHDLPGVRLIYNTASKHGPGTHRITTVADLLSALNALVPLESADGEWGLEDYVVEVAATADQVQPYECFHFQEIKDVLREDDEVVIRGLTNEELRERRQGGRLQITSDGRHLIDGLSWGRRWRAGVGAGRPEIMIPPRKRRRIMVGPESDEGLRLELEYPPSRELVPFANGGDAHVDEDEDEDDEDYEDRENEDERMSDEDEQVSSEKDVDAISSPSRQVTAKVMFDNIDSMDEDDADENDEDADSDGDLSNGAEAFAAELKALKNDAGIAAVNLKQPRLRRRKPDVSEEFDNSQTNTTFEGFSSPVKEPTTNGVNAASNSVMNSRELVEKAVEVIDDSTRSLEGESGIVTATAKILNQEPNESMKKAKSSGDKFAPLPDDEPHESVTSSSDDESSVEESDDTSSSGDSEAGSSSDEVDSSSDEDSDSGESTSSSDSSLSSIQTTTKPASTTNIAPNSETAIVEETSEVTKILPQKANPPGTGQAKTKRNNERKKLSKILSALKEAGKLSEDADFKTLRKYLATNGSEEGQNDEIVESEVPASDMQDKVSARAEEILARLNGQEEATVQVGQDVQTLAVVPKVDSDNAGKTSTNLQFRPEQVMTNVIPTTLPESSFTPAATNIAKAAQEQKIAQIEPEENSPKRARLDIAASRRMLFNSLGVRNPRTAEAEKALKEKLAKPVRQIKSKELEPMEEPKLQASLPQDRWKNKFTVVAVECIQDWKKIDTPSFPFKQPWQIRQERNEMAKTARQQAAYEETLNYDEVDEDQDTQPMDIDDGPNEHRPSQSLTTSRTLTAGTLVDDDDIPEPSDFSILPALTRSNASEATVVAYKELHINARFEPEQSSYRVAKVISHTNGILRVRLTPRHRKAVSAGLDEKTGERLYNRFEVPDDDVEEDADDGLREVEFDQMIHPKIVGMSDFEAGDVTPEVVQKKGEMHKANGESTLRGGHLDVAVKHLSQTLQNEANVSTPRRSEINTMIKEAGFESGVDDQLLQGLVTSAAQDETSVAVEDESGGNIDDDQADIDWQSSPARPTSHAQASADISAFRESSAPSESMVESVKYPQLSELQSDTPMRDQSSSHQDAQKSTPIPILPPEESTNLETTSQGAAEHLELEPDSLPSEVPQTQSQDFIPDSLHEKQANNTHDPSASPLPDIGPDRDDSASSVPEDHAAPNHDDDDDNESVDSNGFPSLRSLTSSQTRKPPVPKATKSAISKIRNSSPESRRRSPRTSKTTARSSDWSDTDTPSQSQHKTTFKASQSQTARLSQIPEDTIFVDLTQSSPAADSPNNGKDSEIDKGKEKEKAARKGKDKDDGKGGTDPANVFRKSFEGLGEKSYLKRKKRSL